MQPRSVLLAALIFAAAAPHQAGAFCYEPSFYASTPTAPGSYSKPDVPYCLESFSYSGSHTCESWELDAYKRDVEEYVRKLNDYANEAVDVANRARRYALEAQDYAKCEADEVLDQHK